jgi:glycosyltransferase involved in cell wall biosynthesis
MDGPPYTFTVFTPTYNRAHTLPRVFESLTAQTFRDFEWLVVDDGSTDNTEQLVAEWRRTAPFPIRYIRQANQGKHVAHNRAVQEANGALFVSLDSDDACVPEALERLNLHWNSIAVEERGAFSAVTVLCRDQHGNLVGDPFPFDVFDANLAEITYRYKVRGEKWGFQRTDILRHHLFTADTSRGTIPEGIIWLQIGMRYRMRFVNEVLRIYYIEGPSLSRGRSPELDAYGRHLFYVRTLNDHIGYLRVAPLQFFKAAVQFARASFHLGISVSSQSSELQSSPARVLWALSLPVAWLLWKRDTYASQGAAQPG